MTDEHDEIKGQALDDIFGEAIYLPDGSHVDTFLTPEQRDKAKGDDKKPDKYAKYRIPKEPDQSP